MNVAENDLSRPTVDVEKAETSTSVNEAYSELADAIRANQSFAIYRRFSYLMHRLMLHKQERLADLEKELRNSSSSDEKSIQSLMAEVEKDWLQYRLLMQYGVRNRDLRDPSQEEWAGKRRILRQQFNERLPAQMGYTEEDADVVTMNIFQDDCWWDGVFISFVFGLPARVGYLIFGTRDTWEKETHNFTIHETRLECAKVMFMLVPMLLGQLAPLAVLWYLTIRLQMPRTSAVPLVVALSSVLVFYLVFAANTNASRKQVIAASTIQSAVLFIFVIGL